MYYIVYSIQMVVINIVCVLIQMYCVLHAMSLRWPWPESWVIGSRYILLLNLDVWEFFKLNNNGTYKSVQGLYIPSDMVSIKYWNVLVAWGALLLVLVIAFIITYCVIRYLRSPFQTVQLNRLQRVYIILIQVSKSSHHSVVTE